MTKSEELSPKDLLVYVTIKSYMNKDSKECFPSLDTIVQKSGISKPTVRKSIENLKNKKYIFVRTEGRRNVYRFNSYKNFEPFSYEFLNNKEVEPSEKAYVIASQQLMFKDTEGYGKITYSDSELSKLINLDKRTIAKYDKSLEQKGFLSLIHIGNDQNTGIQINEKIFHLDELGQAIIWTLQKHEEDIEKLKIATETNEKSFSLLLKENEALKKRLDILEEKLTEIVL